MEECALDLIGAAYGTDKSASGHDYLRRYEPFISQMRYTANLIVEVGIAGGASLKLWRAYFPFAHIMGVDHNPDAVAAASELRDVTAILGDATDAKTWQVIDRPINFFCDDGSHHSAPTIKTFQLVWPLMAPASVYAIEDLHSSYDPAYNRDGPPSTVEYFKRMIDNVNESGASNTGQIIHPATDLAFMHFSKSLLVIGKR